MKIAIVSDTHFGYKRFEQDALAQGKEAFQKAAELADVILSPGDIFDDRLPSLETIISTVGIFREVANKGKPVYAIPGTHERKSKELANPIDILEKAGLVVNVHNKTEVFECNGERITISGLGGVPEELAAASIKQLNISPQKGAFNLFMFHQTLLELTPMAGDSAMSLEDLPDGFQLYVCGHYHKKRIDLKSEKKLIIPGSTVLTQLKEEEQEDKGFLLLDSKKMDVEFVPINARKFRFIRLEFSNATAEQVRERVRETLENTGHGKKAVRIVLDGTLKEGQDLGTLAHEIPDTHVQIDNLLVKDDVLAKIEQIREFRNREGRSVMAEILKDSVAKSGLEKDFDWARAFEVFSESDQNGIADFVEELKRKNTANVLKQSTESN